MSEKTYETRRMAPWLVVVIAVTFLWVITQAAPHASAALGGLTLSEISTHNSAGDCWMIVGGKVYNVTSYIPYHPGGAAAITPYCGGNGTAAFMNKPHSQNAQNLLASYYVGDVAADTPSPADTTAPATSATAVKSAGGAYTFSSWTNSPYVNVTLACTDPGSPASGCNATLYCKDTANTCAPNMAYSAPVQISTQGTSYIRYLSRDSAGNAEAVKSQAIKIDTVAPAVAIASPASTTYNGSAVALKFTAADSGSGVTSCIYGLDANAPVSGCANATLSAANGTHTVAVNATDAAGNSNGTSVSFNVSIPTPPANNTNSTNTTTPPQGPINVTVPALPNPQYPPCHQGGIYHDDDEKDGKNVGEHKHAGGHKKHTSQNHGEEESEDDEDEVVGFETEDD